LAPGDRLVIFTDGLSEATNDSQEEFGEERLVEAIRKNAALPVNDLQKQVIEAVAAFCQGSFQDDATLMAVSFD
jgi:sigma-B regulation protein RsbU (phosphoserine phosphatase)